MTLESLKYFLKFKTFKDLGHFKNKDHIFELVINWQSSIAKIHKVIVISITVYKIDGTVRNSLDIRFKDISFKSGVLKFSKLEYSDLVKITSDEHQDIKFEVLTKIDEIKKDKANKIEIARQEELKKQIELVTNIKPENEVVNFGTLFTKLLKNTFNTLKHPEYTVKNEKLIIHSASFDSDFNITYPSPNHPQAESSMRCYINDLIDYNVSLDISYLKEINRIISNK